MISKRSSSSSRMMFLYGFVFVFFMNSLSHRFASAEDDKSSSCAGSSCDSKPPPIDETNDECKIYRYDTWNLAGVNYSRGDKIGEVDVVIPLKGHNEKAWPMWTRYYFFWKPNNFDFKVFAPALDFPFECHESLWNVRVKKDVEDSTTGDNDIRDFSTYRNYEIEVVKPIRVGDPIYLPCFHEGFFERGSSDSIYDFPRYTMYGFARDEKEWLNDNAECIDNLQTRSSEIPDAGLGSFAKRHLPKGTPITYGPAIHFHRSELQNTTSKENELLLNYCLGNPKMDVLLLSTASGANYINHDSKRANVKIEWGFDEDYGYDNREFFTEPSHKLLLESELNMFFLQYVALRDIKPGEEILLDYGDDWVKAWADSRKSKSPFRHEIGLPDKLFPKEWLDREALAKKPSVEFDVPDLESGEVKQLTLKDSGETIAKYIHRVGAPAGMSEKLLEFGERTGIMDIFRNYILEGNALEENGEEHHQINGGRWWVKRFDGEWHSDMHYITPDDGKSNDDFMRALGDAGFDKVLDGLAKHFGNIDGLLSYYPSFIAVSHCTGTFLHSDSDPSGGKRFNLIFPVMQVNNSDPELNLGADYDLANNEKLGGLIVPYRYEPDVAVALGDDGLHGTAPCDYRDIRQMRVVVSVYIMDVNKENLEEMYWPNDPPYPRKPNLRKYLMDHAGSHWNRNDPSKKLPKWDQQTVKP